MVIHCFQEKNRLICVLVELCEDICGVNISNTKNRFYTSNQTIGYVYKKGELKIIQETQPGKI